MQPVLQPKNRVLLEAINLTFRTMERRTRLYRNLVICVSLTLLGSFGARRGFSKMDYSPRLIGTALLRGLLRLC